MDSRKKDVLIRKISSLLNCEIEQMPQTIVKIKREIDEYKREIEKLKKVSPDD